MGHVHLQVADVPAAIAFYPGVLGLGFMAHSVAVPRPPLFGGDHDHVGANTWESAVRRCPAHWDVTRCGMSCSCRPTPRPGTKYVARLEAAGIVTRDTELGPMCDDPVG